MGRIDILAYRGHHIWVKVEAPTSSLFSKLLIAFKFRSVTNFLAAFLGGLDEGMNYKAFYSRKLQCTTATKGIFN